MKISRLVAAVVVVGMASTMFLAQDAEAISAWAKKYNMDCSACHSGPMYKLTPMGAEFAKNGHRMGKDEVVTELDKLLCVNTKLRVNYSNAIGKNSSFEAHAFSIYTGGVLSDHFSYFTEMYLYENTGRTTDAVNSDLGRGKLADAYLQFNSNPSGNSYTTAKIGQISPTQLLIYWNVGPRYSETRPYVVNNSTVSPNTYRPFMRNFGMEVAQKINDFHGSVALLNGTGSGVTNSTDNNEAKDVYTTADYVLDSQGSAVGVYGYKGRGLVVPKSGSRWANNFHRLGAFGQFTRGPLNLTGVVTKGQEQINARGTTTNNVGFLTEADYNLSDKLGVFGRYDYFDPNDAKDGDHLSGPVLGATYRFIDTGRVVFEYHQQGKVVTSGSKPKEYRAEISFMF